MTQYVLWINILTATYRYEIHAHTGSQSQANSYDIISVTIHGPDASCEEATLVTNDQHNT